MASDVARKADHILENYDRELGSRLSSDTFTRDFNKRSENDEFLQATASSYTLADDRSLFSRDIEHWLSGHTNSTESAGVQGSRPPMVQRSTLVRSSSLDRSGLWYVMAMVLPLFSINTCYANWRCTPRFLLLMLYLGPSMVLNTAELFVTRMSRVCARARAHIQQLAQDQVARELFATAMDIVLVIYAIGFLVLSMYQASIFGASGWAKFCWPEQDWSSVDSLNLLHKSGKVLCKRHFCGDKKIFVLNTKYVKKHLHEVNDL